MAETQYTSAWRPTKIETTLYNRELGHWDSKPAPMRDPGIGQKFASSFTCWSSLARSGKMSTSAIWPTMEVSKFPYGLKSRREHEHGQRFHENTSSEVECYSWSSMKTDRRTGLRKVHVGALGVRNDICCSDGTTSTITNHKNAAAPPSIPLTPPPLAPPTTAKQPPQR